MLMLSNLERTCSSCKGWGIQQNSEWQEYWKTHDSIIPGRHPEVDEGEDCSECEGRGEVLTSDGIKFMQFIRKYI